VGVVLYTRRMPFTAIDRVFSIAATCHPARALTSASLLGLTVRGGLVQPLYQHLVLYRREGYTQAIVALQRELAGSL
jgi:hypothetical protein